MVGKFSDILERFITVSPVCVMVRATMERILSPHWLDDLFERSARTGRRSDTGKVFEQLLEVHVEGGATLILRRITVRLKNPTRDGDKQLHILTTLPRAVAAAGLIAQLYRRRWTIETAFQQLERDLHSELNTLGYLTHRRRELPSPQAAGNRHLQKATLRGQIQRVLRLSSRFRGLREAEERLASDGAPGAPQW
jgi:predicted component of type VI protein secretion system